jgi:hypothetical protein
VGGIDVLLALLGGYALYMGKTWGPKGATHGITGWRARVFGVILAAPLSLSLLCFWIPIGDIIDQTWPPAEGSCPWARIGIAAAWIILYLLVLVVVGLWFRKPIASQRRQQAVDEPIVPAPGPPEQE